MTKVSELREISHDNGGFVTPADAESVGMDPKELPRMAGRGRLVRELQGIYRFPELAGPGSALCGETALAALQLCDVNPRQLHIMVPRGTRNRRMGKSYYKLHLGDFKIKYLDSLRFVPIKEAIQYSVKHGMRRDLARQAIDNALKRDLIIGHEASALRRDLGI
jgi:predicted transcriptional regulator of viral defense system